MKLHAFDDRKNDDRKDLGRHHALDVYTIVALMTEKEYEKALELSQVYGNDPRLMRARQVVASSFSGPSAFGIIRLREHPLFRADFNLTEFIEVLGEILGRQEQG